MPERKNEHVGKPAPRWNVQPLRTLEADIYPTPPTESLCKGRADQTPQKTKRRRPPRPSKS